MHGRDRAQWAAVGDVDLQLPSVDALNQIAQLCCVAAHEDTLSLHTARGFVRSRRHGSDEYASVGDDVDERRGLLRIRADEVEHHVERLSSDGQRRRPIVEVVDDPVRASVAQALGVSRFRGRGYHGTDLLRQLHGVASDRTARPVDEDRLAVVQARHVEQRLPRRQTDGR